MGSTGIPVAPGLTPIMVVLGTRPEALKLAPVFLELRRDTRFQTCLVVTGQHKELVHLALATFDIRPDVDLAVTHKRASLANFAARTLLQLNSLISERRPGMVIVQGDTTSAFTGALAAFYNEVPVAHVEAGLRTGDAHSPFPEEMNRQLITNLSSIHCAPTPSARANLLQAGVPDERIFVTGNPIIDALLSIAEHDDSTLVDDTRPTVLVTAHRRESWGLPMGYLGEALAELARTEPNVRFILSAHPNPEVRKHILPPLRNLPNVLVTEPLDYATFVRLMRRSALILTDSGGIQEEAISLGKPVLVLRNKTERTDGIPFGHVRVVGTDIRAILEESRAILHSAGPGTVPENKVNAYGDGKAAARIVQAVAHYFGQGARPDDFIPPQPPESVRRRRGATKSTGGVMTVGP
jgi:UDP-N-acetylglucosamine 2-epimerase (non-hydrolysing)